MIILDDFQSHLPPTAPLYGSGIDAYVGLVLQDSSGDEIGLLAIFNRKPLGELQELLPILRIFASRAAGELDRIRTQPPAPRARRSTGPSSTVSGFASRSTTFPGSWPSFKSFASMVSTI